MAKKKPDQPADEPEPRRDFMLRLPPELAKRLARYIARQRVKPQEQVVIRTALEAFLDAEGVTAAD